MADEDLFRMTPAETKQACDRMLSVSAEVFESLKAHLLKKFPDAGMKFSGQGYVGRVELHVFCKPDQLDTVKADCIVMEETISYPEIRIIVREA